MCNPHRNNQHSAEAVLGNMNCLTHIYAAVLITYSAFTMWHHYTRHHFRPHNSTCNEHVNKGYKTNWRAVTLSFKLNIVTWQLRYKVTRVKEKNKKRFNSTLYKSTLKGLYRCIKELLDQKPGRATASSEIEAFNGKRTPFQHSIQLYVVPVHPPAWTLTYHLVFQ